MKPHEPVHPGRILRREIDALGITVASFARALCVPTNRVSTILAGKRAVTADTALRLAKALGTPAMLWLDLQRNYDLLVAREALGDRLFRIQPVKLHHPPRATRHPRSPRQTRHRKSPS